VTAPNRLLARFGEVWLKGRNRHYFMQRLRHNLERSLSAAIPGTRVRAPYGRFFVDLPEGAPLEVATAICRDTPGLTSVSPVMEVPSNIEAMIEGALALVAERWAGATGSFAVKARRTDKRFPLTSPEVGARVGDRVGELTGLRTDLKHPDHVVGVEVGEERSWVWVDTERCAGGLPVGCAGRVLLLLSGGIDSPVAGYLAQKRGCELDAVYFHSPPFIGESSREKVEALARRLAPRQGGLRLHVAHFTHVQKAIKAECEPKLTVLLYRRFMYRIAAELAAARGARALCTGENLGQVASQTLLNLALVDRLTELLTLRPLITFDKQETIALARRIGTYDTSILPFDDCCTLFVPRHPALKAPVRIIERQEARLDVEALVAESLARIEVVDV